MRLGTTELDALCEVAMTAAVRAGTYVQSMVGRHHTPGTKEAGSTPASQVVTEVDVESQRLILELLGPSIDEFQLGLLAEEGAADSSRFERDYFWCVDPLDGTLSFVNGQPGYSVAIALVSREGTVQIGAVYDPCRDNRYHAILGGGAFKNGESILCADGDAGGDSDALAWMMDQSMKKVENYAGVEGAMEALVAARGLERLKIIDHAGAVLNALWVTERASSVYFKFPKAVPGGGALWDFAATACILKEWGHGATDIWGQPLSLNHQGSPFMNERGVIYASDPGLRESVVEIFRSISE